ncbi:[4Fe-4S] cluster carrier protein NfuA [hydrothermal vent metagenome]|uniref:[4Fe-4S] cluster carrier protein NfuA n=1 Tax=hydrothermal vent metagenome TaxID=652676 RepID=A0A3B0S9N9_9ZZZZ
MTTDSRILTIKDDALEKLLEIRSMEPDAETLALVLAISGAKGTEFTYAMHMTPVDQLDSEDVIEHHGDLPVAIPPSSVANLTGATLGMSTNLLQPGMSIDNPNSPSPQILGDGPPPDLSGPVAEQVGHVIETQINPAIASHGGFVELVAVEGTVAYVRLGGGCQGCGLAAVTLSQGIESTIVAMVPDVLQVIDTTDHNAGENPFYEQSKK